MPFDIGRDFRVVTVAFLFSLFQANFTLLGVSMCNLEPDETNFRSFPIPALVGLIGRALDPKAMGNGNKKNLEKTSRLMTNQNSKANFH